MQEDLERRTIAISLTTTKLTGRVLAKALQLVTQQIQAEKQKAQTPRGRQSVRKLMNHGVSTSSIDLSGDTKLFDRVARKYNVDYAFHQTGPDKYLLFFKAGQADAITAAFSEYAKRVMSKSRRPSILQQLRTFAEPSRERPLERNKEVVRDER